MPSIIKSSSVHQAVPGTPSGTVAGHTRTPAPSARAGARCRKEVELLRKGELVHAIQLTCSCGEVTVVELSYPEAPEASA